MGGGFPTDRPSTSAGAFMRKPEDVHMMMDEDQRMLQNTAVDDFDKELNELLMKNKQRLAELHSDFK